MMFLFLALKVLTVLIGGAALSTALTWGAWLPFIAVSGQMTYRQALHHLATCSEPVRMGEGNVNACLGRCTFINAVCSIPTSILLSGLLLIDLWYIGLIFGIVGSFLGSFLAHVLVLTADDNNMKKKDV